MELEIIMLVEIWETQKTFFSHLWGDLKVKILLGLEKALRAREKKQMRGNRQGGV